MTNRFRKADMEFHRDGFGPTRPAVNVKVHGGLTDYLVEKVKDYLDLPSAFSLEWIEENLSDEEHSEWFYAACSLGWGVLSDFAKENWHDDRVEVYSEGRSGGWAVVHGINEMVESWDAVDVVRWGRFAKFARDEADHVMYTVVELIADNVFMLWLEHGTAVATTV